MAAKTCAACGERPPKTEKSRFCDDRECVRARARGRKRTQRGQVLEFPAKPAEESSTFTATLEELRAADRERTPLGQAALVLASRLDGATRETGSSVAALARELRATLDEALKDAPRAADALDGLRGKVVRLHGA